MALDPFWMAVTTAFVLVLKAHNSILFSLVNVSASHSSSRYVLCKDKYLMFFQFGTEKCVQCDAFNYVFNEDTGECFNAAGELVDKR